MLLDFHKAVRANIVRLVLLDINWPISLTQAGLIQIHGEPSLTHWVSCLYPLQCSGVT